MNFLKRAGAIFMLLAIFASSCNKYADDFTQVNTKLDAIASSVAGLTSVSTDLAAVKSQITALQTAIAAMPTASAQTAQFAAVTTQLTTMSTAIASLDTQIKAVATAGTATKAVVDGLKTDLAALAATVATNNTAAIAAATAAMAKLNTNETAVAALKTQLTALAAADALVAADVATIKTGVAANATAIMANATALTAEAAQLTAMAAKVDANNAAIAANATQIAANSTSLANIVTSLATLTTAQGAQATAAAVAALQTAVDAQKAQLDLIIANTALKVTDVTIAGTVAVGGVLTASPVPSSATVTYQWQTATTAGGTYADIAGATANKYTIVAGDLNNFFKVKVVGTGSYANSNATSIATAGASAQIAMVSVGTPVVNTAGDAFPQVGKKIKAGTLNPSAATVNWQWQSSTALTGVYTDIAGATSSTYTPVLADANMYIRVVATGTQAYTGVVTSGSAGPFLAAAVTSPTFPVAIGNNFVTITLTDGTFIAPVAPAVLTGANFVWSGTDAALLTSGVYTRVSSTVVTVQTSGTLTTGALNAVSIPSATLATASTGVTAAASTVLAFSDVVAPSYTTVAGNNTVTVTLTGGTFKTGVAIGDLTIAGTDAGLIGAGALVRTSSTVVTITTAPLAGGAGATLTVKASALQTQATSAAAASSVVVAGILSPAFSTVAGNNAVTITLGGGATFKAPTVSSGSATQNVVAGNFSFAGGDAATLSAGTVTYVSPTVVVLYFATIPVGGGNVNNTITVNSAALSATGVAPTATVANYTASTAMTSALFASTAGHTTVTITLNALASYRTGTIYKNDFTFAGTNAAAIAAGTFARTSNTVVTITGIVGMVAAIDNVVTVKQGTFDATVAPATSALGATAP